MKKREKKDRMFLSWMSEIDDKANEPKKPRRSGTRHGSVEAQRREKLTIKNKKSRYAGALSHMTRPLEGYRANLPAENAEQSTTPTGDKIYVEDCLPPIAEILLYAATGETHLAEGKLEPVTPYPEVWVKTGEKPHHKPIARHILDVL